MFRNREMAPFACGVLALWSNDPHLSLFIPYYISAIALKCMLVCTITVNHCRRDQRMTRESSIHSCLVRMQYHVVCVGLPFYSRPSVYAASARYGISMLRWKHQI